MAPEDPGGVSDVMRESVTERVPLAIQPSSTRRQLKGSRPNAQARRPRLRQLGVDNSLVVVAGLAAVVAVVATAVAWRAGRRARRAADLVAQLLEPPVLEPVTPPGAGAFALRSEGATAAWFPTEEAGARDATERAPTTATSATTATANAGVDEAVHAADVVTGQPDAPPEPAPAVGVPPPARGDDGHERREGGGDGSEPAPARIPVLDLDRLRSWLTTGDVSLSRLAMVSVELDNLAFVEERLGYAAGGHLIAAITQRLRTVTRPRDVVAHVNRERFVLVCRDVPDLPRWHDCLYLPFVRRERAQQIDQMFVQLSEQVRADNWCGTNDSAAHDVVIQ